MKKNKTGKGDRMLRPFNIRNDKWFYLDDGKRLDGLKSCSFHDGKVNQHVHGIPLTAILRALDDTGILARWDRKQRVLR